MTEPIFTSAYRAYHYADRHCCRLGLENEQLVSMDMCYSYLYARWVLKGRFKLGEGLISTDGFYSYIYANTVLHRRFELGEKSIMFSSKNNSLLSSPLSCYINDVFKGLIPLDFLELCPIKALELILHCDEIVDINGIDKPKKAIQNKDDVIRILFKKKLLG